jgi:ABC-2 type transport system ATP-binding protein
MDPQSAKLVRDAILALRHGKRTIVVCTHNLAEAELLADRIAIIRQGQIIAEGSPLTLKKQLLGHPVMELRLAECLNGQLEDLVDVVDIVEHGEDWFRYITSEPERVNPQLLRIMAAQNLPVITLSEVNRSLEEVYLKIVEGQTVEEVQ